LNNRITSVFRGSFTTLGIEDDSDGDNLTAITDKLSTVMFQAHLKYKVSLFDRALYAFYVPSIGSINNGYHVLPNIDYGNFNSSALLKFQSHELDLYYHVEKPVLLVVAGGFEKAQGNFRTVRAPGSGLPLSSESYFVGFGGNIDLGPNVALYLRHKIFSHFDRNTDFDNYSGHETTAELKMFF